MASDKMLGSFDQKSAPEDNDLLVEYDASASKVKNVKFGGVWNWIVKKLTSAVINELQTSSKNVVGAINELNSKTKIKSYDILYGSNQGHISAVSYGKVLIVEGYVTAQNTGIQYVLAKINGINAINVTQIIFQVGSMPTDPYCMFGSIELDGQITIGSSTQNTLYRFSAAVLIK